MMSLPTPPGTSHREKENRFSASGSRVVWSQHNQYHCISSLPHIPAATSASKELPTKSILKKRPHVLLLIPDNKQREITPEPSDPLVDLKYLEYPVSKIIASDASLRDLIEAYSVLAARIKACVSRLTDADASWPLFQPLRKHRDAIIDAFIRDLGRALVDPACEGPENIEEKVLLPSPKLSPRKKKGMSAEQAKYARDLCTTCHSVVKLLATIFTLPAIHQVFSDKQLRAVLTQVLAIPLADELPTPNARKTCALSIWLLQTQRLPSEVLLPSRDRIAYALRRGMEGELGKEGKKGSASDGLKAIHDLSLYQPSTFVPAFTEILPSILANLLAPTLNRRSQACHALGGFALACASLPPSYIHTRISSSVASFLATDSTPKKSPSKKSPSKKSPSTSSEDPPIIRTIRTTLGASDPQHPAQGPVWALSILAHLIVLLGNALCTDIKVSRVISALLTLSMRHKKPAVKGVALLVWRVATWAYFQPPLLANPDEESGNDEAREQEAANVREEYWKVVTSMVEMGVGTGTITALLNTDLHDEDYLKRVISILIFMAAKGGEVCSHAMQIVKHFVSFETADIDWNLNKLLPPILFSSSPGLLNTEFKSLSGVLRPVFGQFPELDDVRSLTMEEIAKDSVFTGLVGIWKEGLACIELPDQAVIPTELIEIWTGLLTTLKLGADTADSEEASEYAVPVAVILVDLLQDANLDLTPRVEPTSNLLPTSPIDGTTTLPVPLSTTSTNAALKLKVIRDLWSTTRIVIPHEHLGNAGEKLLSCLMENEREFTDPGEDAQIEWSSLCAELLVVCDVDVLRAFWGCNVSPDIKKQEWNWASDVRTLVWKRFVEKWKEDEKGNWEGGVVLLGVPFADANTWALSTDDFGTWEDFLCHAMNKALDYGVDSIAVLDHIAGLVSQNQNPTFTSSTRVADLLMSHLDMPDARQIPDAVMEFVNDTLRSSYPPEPRNKVTSMWMIRSLTRVIETCPSELAMNLLETVQDGMCTWISDEYQALNPEEYAFDILPLYQTVLLSIQALPRTVETLERVSPIVESAFCGRQDKLASASDAFTDFWQLTYTTMSVPDSGWPTKIRHCLGLPSGVTVEDSKFGDPCYDADTSFDGSFEADDSFELNGGQPQLLRPESAELHDPVKRHSQSICITGRPEEASVFGHLGHASLPRATIKDVEEAEFGAESHSDFTIGSDPPSTPIKPIASSSRTSTPPRPHKPSAVFQFFPLHSPASPIPASQHTPTTPKRTPLAGSGNNSGGSCSSSNKRRRIENKENESPRPVITSVAERIGIKSPVWKASLVPSKRRLSDEWEEERLSKKGKPNSESSPTAISSDSEDERSVASSLLVPVDEKSLITNLICANSRSTNHRESTSPSSSPKKRKGVFMDAVEVPTLREVYSLQRTPSLDPSCFTFSTPLSHRTLRQTRSMTKSSDHSVRFEMQGNGPGRKRRRNSDTLKSESMGDPFSSSPLRALSDSDVLPGTDDLITPIASSSRGSSELSSDDDPHLGQVTPHHLISPALRRARAMTDDPPSDDSNMSTSPSQDVVSRRLRRSGSLRALIF